MYKDLVEQIKTTIQSSGIIQMVEYGNLKDFTIQNKKFPLCFIQPNPSNYGVNYTDLSFQLFLLDQKQKSNLNELDIFNQMEQVAHQFIVDMSVIGTFNITNVMYDRTTTDFIFWTQDEGLSGVVLTFTIRVNTSNTYDCIPFDSSGYTITYDYGVDGTSGTSGVDGQSGTAEPEGVFAHILTGSTQAISGVNWEYISGPFENDFIEGFTIVPTPAIRYDGTDTNVFIVQYTATIITDKNGVDIKFCVFVNGSEAHASESCIYCKYAGEEYNGSGLVVLELAPNDELSLMIMDEGHNVLITYINYNTAIHRFFNENGKDGTSGINGTSGSSGINGTPGVMGTSGTSGSSGISVSGTSGSSGVSGINGTSGTSGLNGSSGTSGINGANGTSGTSGLSGTSGINGANGTSGTSGLNGSSGTSGVNGLDGSSGTSGITPSPYETIGFSVNNGSNVITTGLKGYKRIDFNATILEWVLISTNSGSCSIDIMKGTYGDYPTNVSIVNSNYPVLTNQLKNSDTDLNDWTTTTITSGDIIEYSVLSATTITDLYFYLKIQKI